MNRTHLLLLSAAVLTLLAVVAGSATHSSTPTFARAPVPYPRAERTPLAQLAGAGPLTLTATPSSDHVLAGDSEVYVRVNVAPAADHETPRQPLHLAIAIDQSGSMAGPKIDQARVAASALLDQLQRGDTLSIIAFSTAVNVFPTTVVDEASLERMRQFISAIQPDGSTNIADALMAAHAELMHAEGAGMRRIVLLSDGRPNVGISTPAGLRSLVDGFRTDDISTSAFGIGFDYDGTLMQSLADHGGGNYAFIENFDKTSVALTNEVRDAARTVARQVALQVMLPEGVTLRDAPGHWFSGSGGVLRVPLYDFACGQSAQVMLKLRVGSAAGSGAVKLADLTVGYIDAQQGTPLRSSAVHLVATGTTDPEVVSSGADAEVLGVVKKLDVNVRLAEAEAAYESGNSSKALGLLDGIRSVFGASADALAGDDLVSVRQSWAHGGDEGSLATKSLMRKTMKNFGQNNVSQY